MSRQLVSLAIAALLAHATWRIGTAYVSLYGFQDQVHEVSLFSPDKSEEELRQRVLELASQYALPVRGDSFSIRRVNYHTYIDGSYTQPIEVLPRFKYPWSFSWSSDTLAI